MAVKIKTKNNKTVVLLNPSEKGEKFAKELKKGRKITNSGSYKLENGKSIKLTDTEKAFRSGYLQARKDSAKCYNAKVKNKKSR